MIRLNEEQKSAVTSESRKILCLAGAGTGKTQTMIHRIGRLVAEGADASSILTLTFTNAAAFEMRDRFIKNYPNLAVPEFRTFHAFCYSLISRDIEIRNKLGYTQIPKICDEATIKRIKASVKLQCNVKLSDSILDDDRDSPVYSQETEFQRKLYRKALAKEIRLQNVITFDMLCYNICQMFADHDDLIISYLDKYKYIFVDEFQDTDPKQWKFVQSFDDANLFVVGDALQAIYSFRGADSSIIKALSEDDEWEVVRLFRNYRSTSNICECANSASNHASDKYRVKIASEKSGRPVSFEFLPSGYHGHYISSEVAESVIAKLSNASGSTAILCKTNAEVGEMCEILNTNEIPYSTGKRNDEAAHIVRAGRDNDYAISWLSTFLDAQSYSDWIRVSSIYEEFQTSSLKKFAEFAKANKAVCERANKIFKLRMIMKNDALLPMQKCVDILALLKVRNIIVDTDAQTNDEIIAYLEGLFNTVEDGDVYVGTIHSSKGLEYNNVFLLNVGSKQFQLSSEENRNVYYVGITRARDCLTIYQT